MFNGDYFFGIGAKRGFAIVCKLQKSRYSNNTLNLFENTYKLIFFSSTGHYSVANRLVNRDHTQLFFSWTKICYSKFLIELNYLRLLKDLILWSDKIFTTPCISIAINVPNLQKVKIFNPNSDGKQTVGESKIDSPAALLESKSHFNYEVCPYYH